jgi:hypothetical protein
MVKGRDVCALRLTRREGAPRVAACGGGLCCAIGLHPGYRVHDNSDDPEKCCNAVEQPARDVLVPGRCVAPRVMPLICANGPALPPARATKANRSLRR